MDWLKVTQQYYLAVTLPQEDGRTRRVESMWMEAELLNANIPEGMALNMTIDTMAKLENNWKPTCPARSSLNDGERR